MQAKVKSSDGATTYATDGSSAPLLRSPLNMYSLLFENDPEAWD